MTGARLQALLGKVDALTLRERLLLFAAAVAVLLALWEALLEGPITARAEGASARIETLRREIGKLNDSVSAAAGAIGDGAPGKLRRLELLRRSVDQTAESIHVFTSDLVDPRQMRAVLEDLIRRQKGLRLVSMSSLPVESLATGEAGAAESGEPQLYRHGLVLVMQGSYLDCMQYLRSVEALPWQLYWARLELENDEYPMNRILIELHTLSLEEDWIGV
ncbi:MAG TPA: MSHA biogenesis protein MshJ [Woeseiaceae bacterium]